MCLTSLSGYTFQDILLRLSVGIACLGRRWSYQMLDLQQRTIMLRAMSLLVLYQLVRSNTFIPGQIRSETVFSTSASQAMALRGDIVVLSATAMGVAFLLHEQ